MLKTIYKFVGLMYTSFILFLFFINYNFLSFKEGIFIKVFYSIKINFIYYLFYLIYILIYLKYMHRKNKRENIKQ